MSEKPQCAFCENTGLTKEHIFPAWLRKVAPEPGANDARSRYSAGYQIQHHDRPRKFKSTRIRTGGIQSHKLRIVCAACNNGWMSRLQNRAKPLLIPLINGASLQLTDTERFILSSWATMFTMVVEFADVSTMTTSQAEREDFAKTPRPLDHWRIWIGRSERLPFNFLHYAWGTGDLKGAPVPMTVAGKCDSQTTTFAVGNLLFLTFSTTDTLTKIEPVLFALQFGAFLLWPKTTIPSAYEGQFTFLSEKQGIALANAFINRIDARYAATNSIA